MQFNRELLIYQCTTYHVMLDGTFGELGTLQCLETVTECSVGAAAEKKLASKVLILIATSALCSSWDR